MVCNANHIIPSYCYLPVSCRSLVDWFGSLVSCKPQIYFIISIEYVICLVFFIANGGWVICYLESVILCLQVSLPREHYCYICCNRSSVFHPLDSAWKIHLFFFAFAIFLHSSSHFPSISPLTVFLNVLLEIL